MHENWRQFVNLSTRTSQGPLVSSFHAFSIVAAEPGELAPLFQAKVLKIIIYIHKIIIYKYLQTPYKINN